MFNGHPPGARFYCRKFKLVIYRAVRILYVILSKGEDSVEGSPEHSGNLRGFFDSQQGISIGMLALGKHDDWKIRCALQHAQNDISFLMVRLFDKLEFEQEIALSSSCNGHPSDARF